MNDETNPVLNDEMKCESNGATNGGTNVVTNGRSCAWLNGGSYVGATSR